MYTAKQIKDASIEERKEFIQNLTGVAGDVKVAKRSEAKLFHDFLEDAETVYAISYSYKIPTFGLVILTNKRLLVLNKVWLMPCQQSSIYLDKINSIDVDAGFANLPGMNLIKVSTAEKTYILDIMLKSAVSIFASVLNKVIGEVRTPTTQKQNEPNDKYTKFEQLFTLKEKGIISVAEYESEKKKLLES